MGLVLCKFDDGRDLVRAAGPCPLAASRSRSGTRRVLIAMVVYGGYSDRQASTCGSW